MKKKGYLLVLSLIMVVMLLGGCAFGPKPEETVTTFMDAVQKFDMKTMNSCVKDADWAGEEKDMLEESSMKDFFTNTLAKMTYTIEESKVDGDTATVPVKVKYYDGTDLIGEAMGEYFARSVGDALTGKEMSDEESEKLLGEIFSEKSKDLKDTFTEETIDIQCVKEDNKWLITDLDEDMLNVLSSNFYKVGEDLNEGLNAITGGALDEDAEDADAADGEAGDEADTDIVENADDADE